MNEIQILHSGHDCPLTYELHSDRLNDIGVLSRCAQNLVRSSSLRCFACPWRAGQCLVIPAWLSGLHTSLAAMARRKCRHLRRTSIPVSLRYTWWLALALRPAHENLVDGKPQHVGLPSRLLRRLSRSAKIAVAGRALPFPPSSGALLPLKTNVNSAKRRSICDR